MPDAQKVITATVALRLRVLYDQRDEQFHRAVIEFSNRLEQTYSRPHDYLLFHLLIGSTPPDCLPAFDFPGGDSVATFVEHEYEALFTVSAA